MTKTHKLILIGFGTVGQALARVIQDKAGELVHAEGLVLKIVGVATRSRGILYHLTGLDVAALLTDFAAYPAQAGLQRDWSVEQLIEQGQADTLVELSDTNLETGQPATDYCRLAIQSGKNVVTANKGPIALAYAELAQLAHAQGVGLAFESTVMAGTPALRGASILRGCTISEVAGILNGTTNYMLTKMEDGVPYADVLAEAQHLGYAEADPSGDVDGHDAAAKVVILANVLLGANITLAEVDTSGISHLTLDDIETAKAEGKRWKLIGRVARGPAGIAARVSAQILPLDNALANINGATNAITYQTDLLGPITLVGAGAGGVETAAGVLADVLRLASGRNYHDD